jgi:diaminopimelate decarboxylase
MRVQDSALKKYVNDRSMILYASKALSFKEMYRIAKDENIGVDVVSSGELYTALVADFPPTGSFSTAPAKRILTSATVLTAGSAASWLNNFEELDRISCFAGEKGVTQKVILRLTPGIDLHTLRRSRPDLWTPNSASPSRPIRPSSSSGVY